MIPKTWDETALADWAMPVAGLNERPEHFSADEYYRAPIDNYRTRFTLRIESLRAIGKCYKRSVLSRSSNHRTSKRIPR